MTEDLITAIARGRLLCAQDVPPCLTTPFGWVILQADYAGQESGILGVIGDSIHNQA